MKKVICALLCTAILLFSYLTVYSSGYEKKFVIDNEIRGCMFQIYWENKNAVGEVQLISPDGTTYKKDNPNYHSTEGLVWINIDVAAAGEWTVKVDGDNLGKIRLEAGTMPDYIKVTQFSASQISNSEFDISWNVTNSTEAIEFSVFADNRNSGNGGTRIAQFVEGASGTRKINIDSIDSGEYYLYIQAVDTMQVPDIQYTKSYYKIVNPNAPAKLNNISYGMLNNESYAKWDSAPDVTGYKFMMFNENESMPFFETTITDNWYTYPITPEEQNKNIELAVAGVRNGLAGDYERFKIISKANLSYKVDFGKSEYINSRSQMIPISYEEPILMSIYINDAAYIINSDKPGDYRVDLLDGENKVRVVFTDGKGNIKTEEKIYYVDTYPPQLQVNTDLDGKHVTNPTVVVSGKTEPAAVLNINGKAVEVDDKGNYNSKVGLIPGKNTIEIKAKDVAGNESAILLEVTFDVFGSAVFYIVIGSLVFTGLTIYYLVIYIRAVRKDNKGGNDGSNILVNSEDKKDGNPDE